MIRFRHSGAIWSDFPQLVPGVLYAEHARPSADPSRYWRIAAERLALDGQLKITDPAQAAEQFGAPLTAPLESRTRLGTRALPAAERDAVAAAAVDTFLRAYG
ncbi:TetR/AcrR family transcriptional regulator C-terminal domain-containing protein [Amycolatopsis methanolica]|uniref:TetR family transcriptional regulator n=1 Tax=Amycolatopsis methanolica 239 TaxID=1068978 RepID=A0A076MU93_AMYME|nr:TetR/AcrR family transcriptional regulator C-terminal domain-containing protein [Amycolatopsis methanolica]AIJ21412.1 TetR family transcriptional regulator [Amycolatopsis methanolica 239]